MQLGRVLCVQGCFLDYHFFMRNKDKPDFKSRPGGAQALKALMPYTSTTWSKAMHYNLPQQTDE
jgi:hypothetical protein